MAKNTQNTPKLTPEQARKNHIWKSQMRSLIVQAHNDGNRKAIDGKMVVNSEVDNAVFLTWQTDVSKLQTTVFNYVQKKKDADIEGSGISAAEVQAARELIFPKWKELLRYADNEAKELHVKEGDVEDLYKFAWEFFNVEGKGTVETSSSATDFRRNVEAFLGCRIAGNLVMTLQDKEIVNNYQKAKRAVANALDAIDGLNNTIADLDKKIDEVTGKQGMDDIRTYFINAKKQVEEELKKTREKQAEGEKTIKKYAEKAQEIAAKIKAAEDLPITE